MNHPITAWYLAQARLEDLHRDLARPQLPRAPRRGLVEMLAAHLPRRQQRTTTPTAPAGCSALPMGCAA